MKATGIVRRIDDLGRVVIPKEIRRTLRIRDGDPLEIYTEKDGEVIFKKYSPMGELGDYAAAMYAMVTHGVCGYHIKLNLTASVQRPEAFGSRLQHRTSHGLLRAR